MYNKTKNIGTEPALPHKDTLIIIGNGFDLWQGLPTGYEQFSKYYLKHRNEIMKSQRVKWKTLIKNGESLPISDVELIYGNPFDPCELPETFWNTFESSLENLDSERLNLFFGKEKKGLSNMRRSLRNANRVLTKAFCDWIATIPIDGEDTNFRFGDNCLFVNFNYTNTIEKIFHVDGSNIIHIHGSADDKDSIIFGHSSHPQLPVAELYRLGGRFRGLYFIEEVLFATDKHVQDNIQSLCIELAIRNVSIQDIKRVYVLGHSMGLPDIEYFQFLMTCMSKSDAKHEKRSLTENCKDDILDTLDEFDVRIQYVIKRYGYDYCIEEIDEREEEATKRRFRIEQARRNELAWKYFYKLLKKKHMLPMAKQDEKGVQYLRNDDAEWHISFFSKKDKVWIESLMTELGCGKFHLYPSIDECLASIK